MDLDDVRSILRSSGVDIWSLIDTAISVASKDYENEIKERRDGIIERLYVPPVVSTRCQNCNREEEEEEVGKFSRESEDTLVNLLQELEDMDITFKALKETDIGRHVNLLRKHRSSEVRQMVKQVVRKWKYLVDAWVKGSSPGETAPSAFIADGDSPQQNPPRSNQNGHHQVPDFGYSPSPNTHNGSSGSDRNNSEPEPRKKVIPRREPVTQTRPSQSARVSNSPSIPNKLKEPKNNAIDPERLASARKRLQDNYQEAQNAKKQRTIQVMDLHDIPKPKNSFFSKNKGSSSQARHW
ncbi:hypothetical protein IFM89_013405 [Coptis chinensis]|uniref:TFIIS N-terminal domain-containing protein n=1 Tax=Coptis chinensis TaxID=261450 RepID=A0A835I0P4_9MAGN|nr:hypothetical protein IFM89_013405 [Coptis chinensis]